MTIAEFWKERYGVVVAENKALGDKLRETLDENKELKKKVESLEASLTCEVLKGAWDRIEDLKKELEEKTERLDKSIADRKELQADRDFWVHDSVEKTVEIQSLKSKVESLEADLKSETCSRDTWRTEAERVRKELTESYTDGYSDGNEEGQNELWEMLQMVKDMQPNEFDTECECLGDVIDMDLEDFKEAYDKWEAEKKKAAEEAKKQHTEHMRSYLKKFCVGRLCFGCPLYNASEPVSSCLFSKLTDEEIEKRYRKAVDSEYKKTRVPVSARLPQPWECTIEGKVEINEDILKVVCGTIKDDKEEES